MLEEMSVFFQTLVIYPVTQDTNLLIYYLFGHLV